jgi:drug/metabolite transporter (DMT)-like permease
LLWAVLLGWALWNTHPLATTWIGAAVIVASGLYTLYREHKLGKNAARVAEPL